MRFASALRWLRDLRPLRHSGQTHAPTPTGDYAPSLRSPWRAADEKAAAALKRMKEILDAATPYGMIKEVESLIQTADQVNAALFTKRRDHVLTLID